MLAQDNTGTRTLKWVSDHALNSTVRSNGFGCLVILLHHQTSGPGGPDPQVAAMRRSVGNEGEADGRWRAEDACLLRPNGSHVNLFGHLERIIDFDAEVSRSALDSCMAQQ